MYNELMAELLWKEYIQLKPPDAGKNTEKEYGSFLIKVVFIQVLSLNVSGIYKKIRNFVFWKY